MDSKCFSNLPEELPLYSDSPDLQATPPFYLDPIVAFHLYPEAPVPAPFSDDLPLLSPTDNALLPESYREPCPFPFQTPFSNFEVGESSYGPAFIRKRNERERQRVKCVNEGYARLRRHLPEEYLEKRLSKVETLRAAIKYIDRLRSILSGDGAVAKDLGGKGQATVATFSHQTDPIFRIV
ncbi:achaete-scute homolog 3 [Tachyglossus aculeatus]|uniref:achaete-scute homolog 3 n=1 Tax=Tachyglossus aculeatus TaxID=9261 RepID=UPI0018F71E76|nr:achaete-scute homolog 3 [Tachyglossus aculeatus]